MIVELQKEIRLARWEHRQGQQPDWASVPRLGQR